MASFKIENTECEDIGVIGQASFELHDSAAGDLTADSFPWEAMGTGTLKSGWIAISGGSIFQGGIGATTSANAPSGVTLTAAVTINGVEKKLFSCGTASHGDVTEFVPAIAFNSGDSIGVKCKSNVTLGVTGSSRVNLILGLN